MRDRFSPAKVRELCLQIIGEGAHGQHNTMAEEDAAIAVIEAALTYHCGNHVDREDVRDYMAALHEQLELERDMPQSYDSHLVHAEWDRRNDALEYRVTQLGKRIAGEA